MTERVAQLWSSAAAGYDRMVDAQLGSARALVRARLSREGALGRVVEFGCGTGYFSEVLAGRAEELVATDLAPGMIEEARRALRGVENVRVQIEDCMRTSFAEGTFDAAFMSLVLHFVDGPTALREMRRILRPGGALISANLDFSALSAPEKVAFVARRLARRHFTRDVTPPVDRRRILSEAMLRRHLERAGFEIACCETIRDDSRRSCPIDHVKAIKLDA